MLFKALKTQTDFHLDGLENKMKKCISTCSGACKCSFNKDNIQENATCVCDKL